MGKTAIHMGGSLQTLFGIKGSRWDNKYGSMYSEAWVYPSENETPAGFEKVEGGCYWNNKVKYYIRRNLYDTQSNTLFLVW